MPDYTSDSNSNIDSMLGVFFGNVSQRAFGSMGRHIDGLEDKFKRLNSAAASGFQTLRASAEKVESVFARINRQLQEQANRIKGMPRMRQPLPTGTGTGQPPRSPQGTGQGRGSGGRGGGGRFRFGGTSAGNFYAGGFGGLGGLGTLGAAYGIGSIARSFGGFDANIHTLMAEAGPDISNVGGQAGLTQNILDIAGATQFSTTDVSEAMIMMVKDGVRLQDALKNIPSVLKLAVAESTDLTTAWATTNTFVSGLNVPLSESVRLMDMMSNATSLSKLKLENIQYIAGQSLSLYKEIAAFSEEGFLGISGILGPLFRPERIGTGLKQLSLLLPQAASGQLAGSKNDVFESWGVNITDAAGNLKDEVSVLKEFERVFAGMSGEARNVELAKVFGTEAAPVFSALIGQSAKLADNMRAIRKAGTLDEKFAIHSEALKNKWELLKGAGDALIKKFMMILNEGNAFGTGIEWITAQITNLTGFMEANKDTIQAWWSGLQKAVAIAWEYRDVIAAVIVGITAFKAFNAARTAVLGLKLAFDALTANPWGLAIAGIVAGAYLIIKNWEPIKAFFLNLFYDITDITGEAWENIKAVFATVGGFFSRVWGGVTGIAETAWDKTTSIFSGVFDVITSPIKSAVGFIREHWDLLKGIFKWTPYGILIQAFAPVIKFFASLADKLKEPLGKVFDWISEKFDWLKSSVIDLLNWLPGVNIGTSEEAKRVLPEIERIPGETPVEYKFRQKQEATRLRLIEEEEVMRSRTIEEAEEKRTKAREAAIKRQRRLRAGDTALGGFEKYERYTEMMKPPKIVASPKSTEPAYYETRAVTTPVVSGPVKPEASYQDFLKEEAESEREAAQRRRSFGLHIKPRGVMGTRKVEDLYKIDDRAMSNVREHFEDAAEKEFFSRLGTYAEQAFSHIDSTLTDAQRSMREKVFATQKMLKEDKARWQKIVESGALDRFSASVKAAGVTAKNKELTTLILDVLKTGGGAALKMESLKEEGTPAVLQSLEGKVSPADFAEIISIFNNLKEHAPYIPGMQRALALDEIADTIQKTSETARLKRGHELLLDVMKTGDTVTQTKERLSEEDAGSLQSAFDQLKPFANQLPLMRNLLARESMLTGEPEGRKMNVFEFPTLTKEQHVELTSVFNSGFLSLTDINSAQLAVLKIIARQLGSGDAVKGLGPVIKQQKGTLHDDYLSHRDSETQKQALENFSLPNPVGPAESLSVVNIQTLPPAIAESFANPENFSLREPNTAVALSVDAPSVSVIAGEVTLTPPPAIAPNTEGIAAAPATLTPGPQETTPLSTQPLVTISMELPIVKPEVQDIAAPHAPVVHPNYDTRIDDVLYDLERDGLGRESAVSTGEVTASGEKIEKTGSVKEIRIDNINVYGTNLTKEELEEAIRRAFQKELRESNF